MYEWHITRERLAAFMSCSCYYMIYQQRRAAYSERKSRAWTTQALEVRPQTFFRPRPIAVHQLHDSRKKWRWNDIGDAKNLPSNSLQRAPWNILVASVSSLWLWSTRAKTLCLLTMALQSTKVTDKLRSVIITFAKRKYFLLKLTSRPKGNNWNGWRATQVINWKGNARLAISGIANSLCVQGYALAVIFYPRWNFITADRNTRARLRGNFDCNMPNSFVVIC